MAKPNIFLIVADSLRYDHVGPQNGQASLTPNLDRLAQEGIVFEQAISQGPSTRVAMSAMMSSTYASLYGGQKHLSSRRPVIQTMLKQGGYETAGITSNLYLSESFGWSRGFDYYDDCRPEAVYHRKFWLRAFNQAAKVLNRPLGWPKSLPAELVFENAERILRRIHSPFFMWIHLMDTHWPYAIQRFSWSGQWRKKREEDKRLRPRLVARPPQVSPEEHKTLLSEYRESVQYTDKHIGGFVRQLQQEGLLQNSWLVITADHGEEFGEHGQYFHHPTLCEELVHVPLIIRPPDDLETDRGYRHRAQIRLVDLVPTFLDIAGVAPDRADELVGNSLLPLHDDKDAVGEQIIIIESPENQTLALRLETWKYIWHVEEDRRLLFNLADDPREQQNIAATEPQRARRMHAILQEHLDMTREAGKDGASGEIELDEALLTRLRDLGYAE